MPQQMVVDGLGLLRRTLEPGQHGLFGHAEHKADAGQINADQEHLEGHHDLLFREVRRSKKTVSRVSAKCVAHVWQRKMRRLPLWVRYVAIALTLPCCIRL